MVTKEELKIYLKKGYSYRKIAKEENISNTHVGRLVKKYNLNTYYKYTKSIDDPKFLNKINTKEKAYLVGFILGDGYISEKNDVELGVTLQDKQLLKDIQNIIPWETNLNIDTTLNKKTRRFPRVRMQLRSRSLGKNLNKIFGGRLKNTRSTPIVTKHYQKYLLAGFFDADGCITWGFRKDRDKLWHKATFTSSLDILIGIQKILLRYDISSIIRPKKNEKCFIIEISSKDNLKKLYNLLPTDGIRLTRKVIKYKKLIENM